jgi:hypothetical protein
MTWQFGMLSGSSHEISEIGAAGHWSMLSHMSDEGRDKGRKIGETVLVCHRCGCQLEPGDGTFWIVRIDAVCDPSPPRFDMDEPLESLAAEYETLIAQMSEMSERELMDQVHRRMVLHLCSGCFHGWYDDPTR